MNTPKRLEALVTCCLCLLIFSIQAQVTVSTLAGSGTAGFADGSSSSAQFDNPLQVCLDTLGNVYVADYLNERVRRIDTAGNVTTIAGTGSSGFANGSALSAQFDVIVGIAIASNGDLITSELTNRIRKISSGTVSSFAGNGTAGDVDAMGTNARFNGPTYLAFDGSGNIYVADRYNHKIKKITAAGAVTTFAGSGTQGFVNGASNIARFNRPFGVVVGPGDTVYVADRDNHAIRKIDPLGNVTTLAGTGSSGFLDAQGTSARFNNPTGVAVDSLGNVYVSDRLNHRIRRIESSGLVSTLAGTGVAGLVDGDGSVARFYRPTSLALDFSGNRLVVGDAFNHVIRDISLQIDTTPSYCDTLIQTVYDTVTLTDTLTIYDTVTVTDTLIQTVYDTIWMTDTIWVSSIDTVYIQDTIYITDTVYLSSIEEGQTEMGIKLYPNPVNDVINLSYDLNTSANVELRLLDASGRVVKEWPLIRQASGSHSQQLFIGNLEVASQVMFLHVKMNDKVNVYRVLLAE